MRLIVPDASDELVDEQVPDERIDAAAKLRGVAGQDYPSVADRHVGADRRGEEILQSNHAAVGAW